MITNFIVFPLFLLSGALFPVGNLPPQVQVLAYLDPLTYGVDGLRGALLGLSSFPFLIDLGVLALFSLLMVALGAFFFERCQC
jgi:ABC-2 type transport system permease protein